MNMPRRSFLHGSSLVILVAALAVAASTPAHAALPPIVWGSPQTVSGDSDVSTTGSLVYAYTFGGTAAPPSATVNGVTFSPFRIPGGVVTSTTVGSVSLAESPGNLFGSNSLGSSSAPYSALSTDYKAILGSGAYADVPASITVTLGGLTSGQNYLVQWWTNNASNAAILGAGFTNTTALATNSVTLDANTTNIAGGVGQFALGTFTASGTTQTFLLSETGGDFNPLINALQVRAVPEPVNSALAIVASAASWMAWRRRGRRSGTASSI
jgi:hypothetical protein